MAIYRNVQLSFWTDPKVADEFTPEDKYFYLYLMTNPHTNLCGCYELSLTQASFETGYSKESISRLIDRMENVHNVIKYSKETKEILILNWSKYNWTRSEDFKKPLLKEIANIKNSQFSQYLCGIADSTNGDLGRSYDRVGTTVTVTVTNDKNINTIKDIILYLNSVCNTRYKYNSTKTQKLINARLNEGFTLEDFKQVIDKKYNDWKNTKWEQYLRPETLFGTKFEGYLNQKIVTEDFDIDKFLESKVN